MYMSEEVKMEEEKGKAKYPKQAGDASLILATGKI